MSKKVRGIFLIIEIRAVFVVNKMSWQPFGQVAKWWIHSACGGPFYMKFWLQLRFFEAVKSTGSDFTQHDFLR